MKIYNSLTDKLEEFKPIHEKKVSMYVCGPTVYNYVHIGNMRPVITFDMVYNYLKYIGYEVKYASNFTDVNPKIIAAAKELKITEKEVADKFIEAYLNDLKSYHCGDIDKRPTVRENMENIYNFIEKLIEKGYAYEADGDVYFRVSKIKNYGLLSNNSIDELESGARVDVDLKKEDPLDFALWRKTEEGEQFLSPWGKGIPGWHTECVVMINSIFGEKIDIHGGGVDLKFPHHENEIAQSMALNNNTLANFWMHNGHINVENVKMSKSLNNFVLAKDFIKDKTSNMIKLALFKTHYRLPFNITQELLEEAKTLDEKINNAIKQAMIEVSLQDLKISIEKDEKIIQIMDEDFNTPNLISYLLDLVKELNQSLRQNQSFLSILNKIYSITSILGLKYDYEKLGNDCISLYKKWMEARNNKDYIVADKLREELILKGVI